ncbi:hypothetical protein [Bacillus badius]|uniref:Uncharacterized protein n=1 Tax=Bacillus badius TaxID=1455 RepID=A0ABR5AP10_BACBA|nr:hypothetical protein [Bacillus badius]KIL73712.1 hypothetical protein SD77_2989 [Bacillus badius]MED4715271.1 hypothetical protein [Bacillus badius]
MPKIIKLESARHMDGESWAVGQEIEFKSGKIITEIKDTSLEFPESIDYQFDIYVNDKLWKTLINMPLKVEYSLED